MNFIKYFIFALFSLVLVGCGESAKINHIKQGIVGITGEKEEVDMFSNPPHMKTVETLGTGFFIKDNFIVTCFHVVDGANKIKIYGQYGSKTFEAEVLYKDQLSDVAVIKIKDWDSFKSENQVSNLELADRNDNYQTQEVMSIGHPWGLTWSVSKGIISHDVRRPESNPRWFIQTDARVFPGNSGGPLLTIDGKILGINALMFSKEGGSYGMAIPTPLFMKVINDLQKYGEVRWLSISLMLNNSGKITRVDENGAGFAAGLKVGDKVILIKSNDIIRDIKSADELIANMSTFDYQDKIEITVIREGQEVTLDLYPNYKVSDDFTTALGN